ncbi:unnamed protein product [Ambrosiozyma monospora]|uniref:Unnamed protein product n=1 Tax=Ambrosiozyma monospora TaxID=43982 RepID=A0ACB5T9N7_AMBMO|nr:unnamed protein product [Ambrosiozyma monospora]
MVLSSASSREFPMDIFPSGAIDLLSLLRSRAPYITRHPLPLSLRTPDSSNLALKPTTISMLTQYGDDLCPFSSGFLSTHTIVPRSELAVWSNSKLIDQITSPPQFVTESVGFFTLWVV